ncbi:MAG TPA: protein NirI, partial [Tabrizicola sp.]|nr:protein NirI [Tabrizicola sp.]
MRLFLPLLLGLTFAAGLALADGLVADDALSITAPTPQQAAELLELAAPLQVRRIEDGVPGWSVSKDGRVVGEIGSTWEIAGSVGYSGRPLDVLVALTPDARISGALLVRHNEPVLTLGISDTDIAAYVAGFKGFDLAAPAPDTSALPPVISRATVSTGVIRDGILRTARTLAIGRGLISAGGGVDRLTYTPATWDQLLTMGALAEVRLSMTEAATALTGAKVPVQPGDGDFLHLWAGVIDTPIVGQNLLGQQDFTRAVGNLGAGGSALIV